jgi:ABC-2 type transport system ATP-binding protein
MAFARRPCYENRMPSAIEIAGLSVAFPARGGIVQALREVSLRIEQGQVFGFLGPNGAGKTTTINVLLGFIAPNSGCATIFGADVRQAIARERIGYLAENPDTYRFLTGRELLTMTGRLFPMPRRQLAARTDAILAQLKVAYAADRLIGSYSRGERQRICLAQALINDPDLLILDEPTSGLDPLGRMEIRRLIAQWREAGKTVFFSSHELSEVELICDHIAILAKGRVAAQGAASALVGPGESLEQYFLRMASA